MSIIVSFRVHLRNNEIEIRTTAGNKNKILTKKKKKTL